MNTPRQQTKNFVLKTDGYKPSHWLQFPNNTKDPFLFFESRGGALDFRTFFGLQYILEKHMTGHEETSRKQQISSPITMPTLAGQSSTKQGGSAS